MHTGPTSARRALALLVSLAVFAACPAFAADDEDEPDEGETHWLIDLAIAVDQQSARAFDGSVGYALTPDTTATFGAYIADSTSNNALGLGTAGVDAALSHEFERWGLDAKLGRWQATDLVTARELRGGVDFRADAWSAGPRLEARHSVFDPTPLTTAVTLPGGTTVPVDAMANCTLNNFGYGVSADYAGNVLGGHFESMKYAYRDASCRFDATSFTARGHAARALLSQLLGGGADRLARAVARRIGRRDALLDSEFGGGANWRHADLKLSLDYLRAKDYLLRVRSDTLSTTATADLGSGSGVDMTLGATRSKAYGTIGFVEFAVRARF